VLRIIHIFFLLVIIISIVIIGSLFIIFLIIVSLSSSFYPEPRCHPHLRAFVLQDSTGILFEDLAFILQLLAYTILYNLILSHIHISFIFSCILISAGLTWSNSWPSLELF
jgi:hypothetical protein